MSHDKITQTELVYFLFTYTYLHNTNDFIKCHYCLYISIRINIAISCIKFPLHFFCVNFFPLFLLHVMRNKNNRFANVFVHNRLLFKKVLFVTQTS